MEILSEGLWHLLNIAAFFYMLAALIVVTSCIYDEGIIWNQKKKVILLFLLIADECIGSIWEGAKGTVGIAFALYFFVFLYGCRERIIRRLLRVLCMVLFSFICLYMLCDIFGCYVIPGYQTEYSDKAIWNTEDTVILLFTLLISMAVYYYFLFRFVKKGIFISFGKREKWLTAFYFLYIVSMYSVMVISEGGKQIDATPVQKVMAIAVLFLGIVFPVFILKNRLGEYYKELNIYHEEILQTELAHFQQYKEAQDETRRFRHDIQNNLLCLNALMEENKLREADDYLKSLIHEVQALSPKVVTGDEMLDCIFAAKGNRMQQAGIQFQIDGVLDHGLQWKPIDICSVFANALDNAIEACILIAKGRERKITISLKHTEQYYFIEICNTVEENFDCENLLDSGYTSKKNKEIHGYGLQNMKKTVERYGGMLKVDCKNFVFTLSFIIPQ